MSVFGPKSIFSSVYFITLLPYLPWVSESLASMVGAPRPPLDIKEVVTSDPMSFGQVVNRHIVSFV